MAAVARSTCAFPSTLRRVATPNANLLPFESDAVISCLRNMRFDERAQRVRLLDAGNMARAGNHLEFSARYQRGKLSNQRHRRGPVLVADNAQGWNGDAASAFGQICI